jgi:hypothetical protein
MRSLVLASVVASLAAAGAILIETPARAQGTCGPAAYSVADQKYVGIPCTAPTPKADAGQAAPCGPVAYSVADQKYVGVPCTAQTPKAEAGKPAPCGPVAYSVSDQTYVGVPCPH